MSAVTPSLSAILPLKVTGRHYGENFARLDQLLSSLRHHVVPKTLDRIVIVSPGKEGRLTRRFAEGWSDLRLEVVDEEDYFPAFGRHQLPWQVRPWQRQQIIKLNAPALVNSDFVLTLDPDVLALREVSTAALIPQGRALLEPESRQIHQRWWIDSADVLAVPAHLERPGMHVTPAILSTAVLARLQSRIEEVSGRNWMDTLLTTYSEWTEYSLYLLAAESSGLLSTYHVSPDEAASTTHLQVPSEVSIWDSASATSDRLHAMLTREHDGLFAVVQSNTGMSASEVSKVLASIMPLQQTEVATPPPPSTRSVLGERTRTMTRLVANRVFRLRRSLARRRHR